MEHDTQHYRVLLVEDDAQLASMIADFLTPHGFQVAVEGRGDDAIDRIRNENPDVVVLDVNLPGLDGFAICQAVRADFPGAIIMLSCPPRMHVTRPLCRLPCETWRIATTEFGFCPTLHGRGTVRAQYASGWTGTRSWF